MLIFLAWGPAFIFPRTIRVPHDFPTIKSAVLAAGEGDTVEVDDGHYLEENIVLDKAIRLKAKNLLGAVIQGAFSQVSTDFILKVRAAVEVEGFILKNSYFGIIQRDSPDVAWKGRRLAILNMKGAAVSVNDSQKNVGRASLQDLMVDNCGVAFATNDAFGVDVRNCLVTNCSSVFNGYNHIYFTADQILFWNCRKLVEEIPDQPPPPATNIIRLGTKVENLDAVLSGRNAGMKNGLLFIPRFPEKNPGGGAESRELQTWEGLALMIAGDVFFRFEEFRKSAEFFRSALLLGTKAGSGEAVWRANFGLGKNAEKRKEFTQALEHYQQAVQIIEKIRCEQPLRAYTPGFFSDKLKIYESLIHLYCRRHEELPSAGHLSQAFLFAERLKARGFLDSLEESGLNSRLDFSPELNEKEKQLAQNMTRVQVQLQDVKLSPHNREMLLAELEKNEHEYKVLLIKIRKTDSAYAQAAYPQPITYDEVRKDLLDQETILLEYLLGEENSFAFLATSTELRAVRLPPSAEIRKLVRDYLKFFDLRGGKSFKAEKGSRRLYDLLVGPFHNSLIRGVRKIIIVPDDDLFSLPFETLIRSQEAGAGRAGKGERSSGRFLIENYEVSYAPSASVACYLKARKKGRVPEMEWLGVAQARAGGFGSYFSGSQGELADLPNAGREVKVISRLMAKNKRTLLLDEEADEERFKGLDLGSYRIIHLATHGVFNEDQWWRSVLLVGRRKSGSEDGFLNLLDIYALKLNAGLVVLSACSTGRGKREMAEGIFGLSGAFLYAGAGAVLVSLWNIADRSTAELMEKFYGHLRAGKAVAEALRLAKVAMIRSGYLNPRHWGGFILIGGDGGPPLFQNNTP